MRLELGDSNAHLPTLDVETRWSSTFHMIKAADRAKRVLNTVCHRKPGLHNQFVPDNGWEKVA